MKRITASKLEAAPWVVTRRKAEMKELNKIATKLRWILRRMERRGGR